MKITFKTPEDETVVNTHICVWVEEGVLHGFQYIPISAAKDLLNSLQRSIWLAEAAKERKE